MTDETGRLSEETGELGTGKLPHIDTQIYESRDEIPDAGGPGGPRRKKPQALLLAAGVGVGLLIILGIVIVGAIGPAGQQKTTATSEDAAAQRKIMAENEKKSRLTLHNRPLDQGESMVNPAAQVEALTPETIEQMAAESKQNRAESNLMISQILRQAEAQQAGSAYGPASGGAGGMAGPTPDPGGCGAPPNQEKGNRSLYRGVDYQQPNAKTAVEQRDKDYARERQTMFCYSKTMKQADLYDEPAPPPKGGMERRPGRPAQGDTEKPASTLGRLKEKFGVAAAPPRGSGATANKGGAEVTQIVYGPGEMVRLYEGDFIDSVLQNRIVADTEPSPVVCYVSKDHFDRSGQWVAFPTGTRLIGVSQAVNYMGASRLFIKFDRMILPNGTIVHFPESAKAALALDKTGANGVVSKVNRHWLLQFGTALLVGAIEGMGAALQEHTQPQSAGAYMIYQTNDNFEKILNTIMQRYSNIVPTITVDAGKKIKIFLADDVEITAFGRIAERSYAY